VKKNIGKINLILAEWDPIGVGEDIAKDEYKGYVSLILKSAENKVKLMKCLENIANKMEIGYDPNNKNHLKDLQQVCDKIIKIVKSPE
jgi:hypothetical protein